MPEIVNFGNLFVRPEYTTYNQAGKVVDEIFQVNQFLKCSYFEKYQAQQYIPIEDGDKINYRKTSSNRPTDPKQNYIYIPPKCVPCDRNYGTINIGGLQSTEC